MEFKNCEICGNRIMDVVMEVDDHNAVCWDCATKMANEAKTEGREIEILLRHKRYYEEFHLCKWCDELFSESELHQEKDLGLLCDNCIEEIVGHGGTLWLKA